MCPIVSKECTTPSPAWLDKSREISFTHADAVALYCISKPYAYFFEVNLATIPCPVPCLGRLEYWAKKVD